LTCFLSLEMLLNFVFRIKKCKASWAMWRKSMDAIQVLSWEGVSRNTILGDSLALALLCGYREILNLHMLSCVYVSLDSAENTGKQTSDSPFWHVSIAVRTHFRRSSEAGKAFAVSRHSQKLGSRRNRGPCWSSGHNLRFQVCRPCTDHVRQ